MPAGSQDRADQATGTIFSSTLTRISIQRPTQGLSAFSTGPKISVVLQATPAELGKGNGDFGSGMWAPNFQWCVHVMAPKLLSKSGCPSHTHKAELHQDTPKHTR